MPIFLSVVGLYIVIGVIITGAGFYRAIKRKRNEI